MAIQILCCRLSQVVLSHLYWFYNLFPHHSNKSLWSKNPRFYNQTHGYKTRSLFSLLFLFIKWTTLLGTINPKRFKVLWYVISNRLLSSGSVPLIPSRMIWQKPLSRLSTKPTENNWIFSLPLSPGNNSSRRSVGSDSRYSIQTWQSLRKMDAPHQFVSVYIYIHIRLENNYKATGF